MANSFVALPVPAVDGFGAWVDTSGLAPGKTVIVDGGVFAGTLIIEISNDATASAAPLAIATFSGIGGTVAPVDVAITAQFMRVRRSMSTAGPAGTPSVTIAAQTATTNVFGALAVPAGDGVGAATDLSAGGAVNTLCIVGPFSGQVTVEVSTDAGASFSPAFLCGVSGQTSANGPAATNVLGVVSSARVRRTGSINGQPAPAVSVGSGSSSSSGAGVTSFRGINGLLPSVATAGAVVADQTLVAQWTLGICRVYALDATNGNDANKGYADPATNSAADYAIACAAAGAAALKTPAALAAILPRVGAGRTGEIVLAAGTYAGGLDGIIAGCTGYVNGAPTVRGTGTNATAGCVAFDGSAADCTYQGAVTGTGMNALGYNPTGAPTTTVIQCLRVGGAAPAFATEPALPCGLRIRFDSATATVALRNVCRAVLKVSGTDTLTLGGLGAALPAVPAAGDVFYIEQPGVIFGATALGSLNTQGTALTQITGIAFSSTLTVQDGRFNLAFCTVAGTLTVDHTELAQLNATYTHPVRGSLTVGGTRAAAGANFFVSRQAVQSLVVVGQLRLFNVENFVGTSSGLTVGGGMQLQNCAGPGDSSSSVGTNPPVGVGPRIIGPAANGLDIVSATVGLDVLDITNMGAKPAIAIRGTGCNVQLGTAFAQALITGSTGNTDVGLDVTQSRGSTIFINTDTALPTLTGALGDVRVADGTVANAIVSWADIFPGAGSIAGFVDAAGNRFVVGPIGNGVVSGHSGGSNNLKFSGSIFGAAGATLSYLADTGLLSVANQAVPMLYTLGPLKIALYLSVTVLLDTSANTVTATVYKNGAPTTLTVSIPAGSPVGTIVQNTVHPIVFRAVDTLDLRLDDGAGDAGGVVSVSASLTFAT